MSDADLTRKIKNFVPRCGPRREVVFASLEDALRWALAVMSLGKGKKDEAA